MRQAYFRMSGVDMAAIDGVGVGVVESVLTEYGPDLRKFASEKAFIAHLNLAPKRAVTGGKRIKGKKSAAWAAAGSGKHYVRRFYPYARAKRRSGHTSAHTAQRLGAGIAGFATARKVAQYVYRLLRWGHEYVDEGTEAYEKRYQMARFHRVKQQAATLGYQLAPKGENAQIS